MKKVNIENRYLHPTFTVSHMHAGKKTCSTGITAAIRKLFNFSTGGSTARLGSPPAVGGVREDSSTANRVAVIAGSCLFISPDIGPSSSWYRLWDRRPQGKRVENRSANRLPQKEYVETKGNSSASNGRSAGSLLTDFYLGNFMRANIAINSVY